MVVGVAGNLGEAGINVQQNVKPVDRPRTPTRLDVDTEFVTTRHLDVMEIRVLVQNISLLQLHVTHITVRVSILNFSTKDL